MSRRVSWRGAALLLLLATSLSACEVPGLSTPTNTNMLNDAGGQTDPESAAFPPMADAAMTNCAAGAGGVWTAGGTVTNPTKTAHLYTIFIDFVTAKGDVVAQVAVRPLGVLKPAAKTTWLAGSNGALPATVTGCQVDSVTRYTP